MVHVGEPNEFVSILIFNIVTQGITLGALELSS
jgi:hypothetical protein